MQRRGCHETAQAQVHRVQRGVRRLVDGLMNQLQTVEALAGAPDADRERLAEHMRRARSSLLEDYWQVERQSAELGRLYSASCRLHAASDSEDVFQAIREVARELLGCTRMALYEPGEDRGGLSLRTACGLSGEVPSRLPAGAGPLGQAFETGAACVLNESPSPILLGGFPLSAAIPLRAGGGDGRVLAVLALVDGLAPAADPEHVFELLGTHGGAALHRARLSRRTRALMAV